MKSKYKKILALFLVGVMVLALPCVVSAAYLTDEHDPYKYEDLPSFKDFSVMYSDSYGGYVKCENFIVYYNTRSTAYTLLMVYGSQAYTTRSNTGSLMITSDLPTVYSSSSCSSVLCKGTQPLIRVYTYSPSSSTWVFSKEVSTHSYSDVNEEMRYNSGPIYKNSSLEDVYKEIDVPDVPEPSVNGVTSGDMFDTLSSELVGVLPLVIGFSIGVLAFWKGYYYLRSALKKA